MRVLKLGALQRMMDRAVLKDERKDAIMRVYNDATRKRAWMDKLNELALAWWLEHSEIRQWWGKVMPDDTWRMGL